MPDDPSSQPGFEYRNTVYLAARDAAFARSGRPSLCQLCGQQPAVEAHHWAVDYPPAHKTTAADLTALCAECHFVATTLRRFTRAGGSRHQFCAGPFGGNSTMRLEFTLAGVSPLIMHNGAAGLDTRSALSREIAAITAKRGRNRTDVDDQRLWELECRRSLYLDADGRPTLPEAALRALIEASARKTKQGPLVDASGESVWVSACSLGVAGAASSSADAATRFLAGRVAGRRRPSRPTTVSGNLPVVVSWLRTLPTYCWLHPT